VQAPAPVVRPVVPDVDLHERLADLLQHTAGLIAQAEEHRREIRGEVKEHRRELREEVKELRKELRDEVKELRDELKELRDELKELRELRELRGRRALDFEGQNDVNCDAAKRRKTTQC
jgi:uncharacterized coiled-coil DUF342 family protein